MKEIGFSNPALKWFLSYLREREIFTEYDGIKSSKENIMSGVPQGSILGPLLYNIYSSDLQNELQKYRILTIQYADDTQLVISCNKHQLEEAYLTIRQAMQDISTWSTKNGLVLNQEKTQILPIYQKNLLHLPLNPPLDLAPFFTSNAKNLGVIFDSKLIWKDHINAILKKAYGVYHRVKQFTDEFVGRNEKKIRYILFNSLLISQISFSISILFPLPSIYTKLLNRYIKVAASLIKTSYVNSKDLKKMKILNAENLIKLSLLKIASQNNEWLVPEWLQIKEKTNCMNLRSNGMPTFYLNLNEWHTLAHNYYSATKFLPNNILSNSKEQYFITSVKKHFISTQES